MRTSTEFMSSISAPTISTTFGFRDLVKLGKEEVDVYRFMSNHSSNHYALFCHDPLSHLAVRRCVIMHEVIDECAAALLSFRYLVYS